MEDIEGKRQENAQGRGDNDDNDSDDNAETEHVDVERIRNVSDNILLYR